MKTRTSTGSTIAEFGPALIILLVIGFFPMLDLMGMAAAYACCWYLNNIQVGVLKENLIVTSPDGKQVQNTNLQTVLDQQLNPMTQQFAQSPMGALARVNPTPVDAGDVQIAAVQGTGWGGAANNPEGATFMVTLTTKASSTPFLPIPFIPGLSGSTTYNITRSDLVENVQVLPGAAPS